MKQVFEIPGRLPCLNDYISALDSSRYTGAKLKREAQERIGWAIRLSKVKPMKKVDVHFTWVEENMRRDKDNIRTGAKFILDALVETGVLKGDGWKQIGNLSDSYMVNKENPRIIVEMEEVDAY